MLAGKEYADAEYFSLDGVKLNILWDNDTKGHIMVRPNHETHTKPSITLLDMGKMLIQYAKFGDKLKVSELVSKGAPFSCDWLGMTALHFAAMNDYYEICEILIRGGICKDSKTKVDRTALHLAVYEGNENIVELLLSKKCLIDAQDMLKMTALHWAIEKKHPNIVRMLLKHGANPNLISKFLKTPETLIIETGQMELFDELVIAKENYKNKPIEKESTPIQYSHFRVDKNYDVNKFDSPTHINVNSMDSFSTIENQDIDYIEPAVEITSFEEEKKENSETYEMLKNHGISMLPEDSKNNTLESAFQSGRKLILSEAGKYALNETRYLQNSVPHGLNQSRSDLAVNTIKSACNSQQNSTQIKGNKKVKIITIEMLRKMCGDNVVNSIKKLPTLNSSTLKRTSNNKEFPLNKIMKNSEPIKKSIPLQQYERKNDNISGSIMTEEESFVDDNYLPPNIIEICTDEEMEDDDVKIYNDVNENTEIITSSIVPNQLNNCNNIPVMDISDITRQLIELKKRTEEIQKQLELSQKQSEEYRARLERLEMERERDKQVLYLK